MCQPHIFARAACRFGLPLPDLQLLCTQGELEMLHVWAGPKHERMVYRIKAGHELEPSKPENGVHGRAMRAWVLQQVRPLSLVVLVVIENSQVVLADSFFQHPQGGRAQRYPSPTSAKESRVVRAMGAARVPEIDGRRRTTWGGTSRSTSKRTRRRLLLLHQQQQRIARVAHASPRMTPVLSIRQRRPRHRAVVRRKYRKTEASIEGALPR
jgi:hypothetical protein